MDSLPKEELWEDYNDDEAFNYAKTLTDILLNLQIVNEYPSHIEELCNRLSSIFHCYDDQVLVRITNELLNKSEIMNEFKILIDQHFMQNILNYSNLANLYLLLINFSEISSEFGSGILKYNLIDLIIDICLDQTKIDENNELLMRCVKILNNVARNVQNNITYRLEDLKKFLNKSIPPNESNELGMLLTLILGFLLDEKDVEMVNVGVKAIRRLIEMIKSIDNKSLKSGHYTIEELLNGLCWLAVSDEMKLEIVKNEGINLCQHFLQKEIYLEYILNILMKLSFNETICTKLIKDHPQIEKEVNKLKNNNEYIHKLAEGILFKLHGMDKLKFDDGEKADKFDIFISYSWANKKKIVEIVNNLTNLHYRIWIDEEQMFGSVLESMARGIENSSVVMIGASRAYKTSPNCQLEVDYAMRLKKTIIPLILDEKYQPSGWLGIVLGSKLYFEFSERRDTAKTMQQLICQIRRQLNNEDKELSSADSIEKDTKVMRLSAQPVNKSVESWSTDKVGLWLNDNHLNGCKKKFNEIDGPLLMVMMRLRKEAPEFFNNRLQTEFKMKFHEVLKFHNALNMIETK